MKESADNNLKFHENSRKFSKRVENTVGKGEIARYEQFLLFPQCFQKACFPGASKGVVVWEWVNVILREKKNFFWHILSVLGYLPFLRTKSAIKKQINKYMAEI